MAKLKNKKVCDTCFSMNVQFIEAFEHEDIFNPLYDENESITRVDDVVKCLDCGTIHYMEGTHLCREFVSENHKFNKGYEQRDTTKNWV